MKSIVKILVSFFVLLWTVSVKAEDGSRLWLRYETVSDPELLKTYRTQISGCRIEGNSPTMQIAAKELQQGLEGLLASSVTSGPDIKTGMIIAGTPESSSLIRLANLQEKLKDLGNEGYILLSTKIQGKEVFVITANKETGVLYGVFHFLRLIQTQKSINKLDVINVPKTTLRILDHWDNLDRTVERGYAGFSLWDWQRLPEYISPVYKEYARANASIGINGTVLTNVNANALILNPDYLIKVAALADVFRPYGIRVYLTARFSAPIELGKLKTADPLDPEVIA